MKLSLFQRKKKQEEQLYWLASKSEAGRGVLKRIDENRELLQCLQKNAPEFLKCCPWVDGWLAGNDIFFINFALIMGVAGDEWKKQNFPRPWPGAFPVANCYMKNFTSLTNTPAAAEMINHDEVIENRAMLQQEDAKKISCPTCDETLVFGMRDSQHDFSLGLLTVLECIAIAEKHEQVPPISQKWWDQIFKRFPAFEKTHHSRFYQGEIDDEAAHS